MLQVVSVEEGRQFAMEYGLKYIETSARKNVNVDKVLCVPFALPYTQYALN
jgi:hypothetical protein